MPVRILLIALVITACSQPGGGRTTPPPDPTETPPTTNDPGRTEDTPPTPTMPPPETPDAGAPGSTSVSPGATGGTASGALRPDGQFCLAGGDCASGICEGQGCGDDSPGRCMPRARGCTRDLREYCGCDGQTFRASGSCPLRRYSARGTCVGS